MLVNSMPGSVVDVRKVHILRVSTRGHILLQTVSNEDNGAGNFWTHKQLRTITWNNLDEMCWQLNFYNKDVKKNPTQC